MIVVFIYVILSIVFYMKLFQSFKTYSNHPEMKKVKPGEKLLVVKFHDTPRTPGNE